jgi:hypothetical protein
MFPKVDAARVVSGEITAGVVRLWGRLARTVLAVAIRRRRVVVAVGEHRCGRGQRGATRL